MNQTEADAIKYLSKHNSGLVRFGIQPWIKMALTGMCGNPPKLTELEFDEMRRWPIPDASRMLRMLAFNPDIEPYDLLIECVEVITTNRMTPKRIKEYDWIALSLLDMTGIYMRVVAFHSDTKALSVVVDSCADQLVTHYDPAEVVTMATRGQIRRAVDAYNKKFMDDCGDDQ